MAHVLVRRADPVGAEAESGYQSSRSCAVHRLIVTSRDRTQAWRPVYNQWTWLPALKKAGVERQLRVDGFHALRHFYASTLPDAGETIIALSSYLGHADPGFTLKVYTHLMPSSKQRTRKVVDSVFGQVEGPDQPAAA
jgi:integrase